MVHLSVPEDVDGPHIHTTQADDLNHNEELIFDDQGDLVHTFFTAVNSGDATRADTHAYVVRELAGKKYAMLLRFM